MAKLFFLSAEAAEFLGVPESRLEELVRDGKLRQFRDAGNFNYKVDDIKSLAEQKDLEDDCESASGEMTDITSMAEDETQEIRRWRKSITRTLKWTVAVAAMGWVLLVVSLWLRFG